MASDTAMPAEHQAQVSLTLTFRGKAQTVSFPSDATIEGIPEKIEETFSIPVANQKLMVPKMGLLKPPFKAPSTPITDFAGLKITLLGATAAEVSSIVKAAEEGQRHFFTGRPPVDKTKPFRTRFWLKGQEESRFTFATLRPLPNLPNPERSLEFLQKLKEDAGIRAVMRRHQFSVYLLTEMNPIEHTQSSHEGTSRTLGLNRNQGEVIELRLRTDAFDGYRNYRTIRQTLCHELAHNVHAEHDQAFWVLCKQIEKEVERGDWRTGGHTVGDAVFYEADEVDDHGGWTGGEFVLGVSRAGGAESVGDSEAAKKGMTRREILAKAAEERIKQIKKLEQKDKAENRRR